MKSINQLKKYRVSVNLGKIYKELKIYKLREFSGPNPIIDITAKDPDDACLKIKKNLMSLLEKQNGINEKILNDTILHMSIKRIRMINE